MLSEAFVDFAAHSSFLRLAVVVTALLLAQTAVWFAVGIAFERSAFGRRRRIWSVDVPDGQIRKEFLSCLRFNVLAGILIAALLAGGVLAPSVSSGLQIALTFGACWLCFEIYYWGLHRLLHTRSGYRFHRFHHSSKITTPYTGLSMSFVESLGWIAGFCLAPLLLSFFGGFSLIGFALYLIYNYSGNLVGHINVELFSAGLGKRHQSWIMHPVVYHSLHHARFVNHYGFGSTFMDRLCRTEWSDWPALFERVRSGTPLQSFGERG